MVKSVGGCVCVCVCVQLAERSRELASVRSELCRLQQRGSQQAEERQRQQATELHRLRSEGQLKQEQASTHPSTRQQQ